jgi:hypothetical protein
MQFQLKELDPGAISQKGLKSCCTFYSAIRILFDLLEPLVARTYNTLSAGMKDLCTLFGICP